MPCVFQTSFAFCAVFIQLLVLLQVNIICYCCNMNNDIFREDLLTVYVLLWEFFQRYKNSLSLFTQCISITY